MYQPQNQQENNFLNFDPKSTKTKKKKEKLSHGKANFQEVEGQSFPTKSAHLEIQNFLPPFEMNLLELSKQKSTKCCQCSSKQQTLQQQVNIQCLNCKGNTQTYGKKKVKQTYNSTKPTFSSNFPETNQQKKKKKNNFWQIAPIPSQSFEKQHPELCKNGNIYFPIEDQLFNQYQNQIQPYLTAPTEYLMKQLPAHFQYVLDVWNLLQTFPQYFSSQKLILTLIQVQSMLLDDAQLLNLMSRIFDVFVQDLISDKNETMKKSKQYDFFSLIKFCTENGFLMKIYQKCWPTLTIAFFQYFSGRQSNQQNSHIIPVLQQIADKYFDEFPKNIFIRAKIVSQLTKLLAECNQFRRIVQEKGDSEKKQSKKLLELEEKKKKLSKTLSKLTEQQKSLKKQFKTLNKQKDGHNSEKLENSQKCQNSLQQKLFEVQNIRTLKAQTSLKLEEIESELLNFQQSKNKVTHVELLGMDKNHSYFWNFVSGFDGIVVDCAGKWSSIERQEIKGFMGNLNLRGIRENQLYQALNNFLQTPKQSPSEIMPIELHHKLTFSVDPEASQRSSHSLFQYLECLLTDSENRIVSYLQQRNSRWGSEKQRQQLVTFMKQMQSMMMPEILQTLRNFNQKICVVETQYKIINETSSEEIDTKTRKVQTKIWGISQKYKCHWTQFSHSIVSLHELFFLILILNLNIEKYTSKNRKKRKEFEIVKEQNRLIKTNSARKDELLWEQVCETCKQGGQLLCCDICPKVFHFQCLGLQQIGMKFECEGCSKGRDLRGLLRKSKA